MIVSDRPLKRLPKRICGAPRPDGAPEGRLTNEDRAECPPLDLQNFTDFWLSRNRPEEPAQLAGAPIRNSGNNPPGWTGGTTVLTR